MTNSLEIIQSAGFLTPLALYPYLTYNFEDFADADTRFLTEAGCQAVPNFRLSNRAVIAYATAATYSCMHRLLSS